MVTYSGCWVLSQLSWGARIALGECIKAETLGCGWTSALLPQHRPGANGEGEFSWIRTSGARAQEFEYEQVLQVLTGAKVWGAPVNKALFTTPLLQNWNYTQFCKTSPMQPEVPPQSVCLHSFQSHPSSALGLGKETVCLDVGGKFLGTRQ